LDKMQLLTQPPKLTGVTFDDVTEEDRLLDPIENGELYRKRKEAENDRSENQNRGGRGGRTRERYTNVGHRGAYAGSPSRKSQGSGYVSDKTDNFSLQIRRWQSPTARWVQMATLPVKIPEDEMRACILEWRKLLHAFGRNLVEQPWYPAPKGRVMATRTSIFIIITTIRLVAICPEVEAEEDKALE
jgi:hypothetical protein